MIRLLYLAYRVYCFFVRPKTLGIRVMFILNRQVLLVRQTYMPGWFMPGVVVKWGEFLEQAIWREAREEVGANMGTLQLLGVYTSFHDFKSDHNVLFPCTDCTLSGQLDKEIAEARFFPLNQLPENLLPGHHRRIEEFRNGVQPLQYGEW